MQIETIPFLLLGVLIDLGKIMLEALVTAGKEFIKIAKIFVDIMRGMR